MTGPDGAVPGARLGPTEALAIAVLVAGGLVGAGVLHLYDTAVWQRAVALGAISVVSSFALFWLGMAALGVPSGRRTAGAAWALVPWNSLLLSQIAYVGFFFIPLEIIASTVVLRSRAGLRRVGVALVLATAVRLASFGLVHAARPLVRQLFPWR